MNDSNCGLTDSQLTQVNNDKVDNEIDYKLSIEDAKQLHEMFVDFENIRRGRSVIGFMYTGDLPLGETWVNVASVAEASNNMTRSNYTYLKDFFTKEYPNDSADELYVGSYNGDVDSLSLRALNKSIQDVFYRSSEQIIEFIRINATEAIVKYFEFLRKMDDYPLLDEEKYSELEAEDQHKMWQNLEKEIEYSLWREYDIIDFDSILNNTAPKEVDERYYECVHTFSRIFCNVDTCADFMTENMVIETYIEMGWVKDEAVQTLKDYLSTEA